MGQPRIKTVTRDGKQYNVQLFDKGVIYVNGEKVLITGHRNLADIKTDIAKAIDKYEHQTVSQDAWDKWDGKL